jgi:hypothetical protein
MKTLNRVWEFDSLLEVHSRLGGTRLMQVWSRPSGYWADTREWTLRENIDGKENPPKLNEGHYTSTEAFKIAHPNFNRA